MPRISGWDKTVRHRAYSTSTEGERNLKLKNKLKEIILEPIAIPEKIAKINKITQSSTSTNGVERFRLKKAAEKILFGPSFTSDKSAEISKIIDEVFSEIDEEAVEKPSSVDDNDEVLVRFKEVFEKTSEEHLPEDKLAEMIMLFNEISWGIQKASTVDQILSMLEVVLQSKGSTSCKCFHFRGGA